ncbi:hypothetical protein TVAG_486500 [Trichomonas vaginalis G3]|uniref:RRM domain-containing protein n=1 Tax=Trichomonas vaginalis (strain ATCC PRA-98 / G3) TaxID=412133 RepID=A2GBD0_TRIV3|nr:RNA-binding domain, RBD family-containing protein [Trichomonas vaginalis G3]EAX85534.1 hypothetical protein TVAG_486500 [Trichomonas vaginalis G3]KAI5491210.1 RNA-binding domain, RBD family-containing protein [Trichomonas vaginalis G3]|eukprot:XP_001298464.1 hypothetical protein [Trichomonas vaginalis G3]
MDSGEDSTKNINIESSVSEILTTNEISNINSHILIDYVNSLFRRKNSNETILKNIETVVGETASEEIFKIFEQKYENQNPENANDSILDDTLKRRKPKPGWSTQIVYVTPEGITDQLKEDILAEILSSTNGTLVSKERFIVFVAGLESSFNSISRIYKVFKLFGRICAIEEDKENNVAFIEYAKLVDAYHAVKKAQKLLGNKCLRVEFAKPPNPDAIHAIEQEIEKNRGIWQQNQESEIHKDDNTLKKNINIKGILVDEMKDILKRKMKNFLAALKYNDDITPKLLTDIQDLDKLIKENEKSANPN